MPPIEPSDSDRTVRPFELFFDLVFVFAFTQVTLLMATDITWRGLGGGFLLLGTLWLAWQSYAWLGTAIALDEGGVRLAMLAVMGGMLTAALATPGALSGDAILFAAAYAFVRVMMLVLVGTSAWKVPGIGRALLRLVPSATLGPGLVLAGAISKVGPLEAWIGGALLLEYGAMYVMDLTGWKISPGHFAERHGLIFIVALGEAVISIGVGAAGLPLDEQVVLPAVIGLAVIVGLWWTYFDMTAPIAERVLSAAKGAARAISKGRILLPPLAHGGRGDSFQPRCEEDAGTCPRSAFCRTSGRAVWRTGALPSGSSRIPRTLSSHLRAPSIVSRCDQHRPGLHRCFDDGLDLDLICGPRADRTHRLRGFSPPSVAPPCQGRRANCSSVSGLLY